MQSGNLQRAVKRAIAEAELACDPMHSGLMDRGDLQRTIGRLKQTLEEVSVAFENLHHQQDDFAARLTRNHLEGDWMQADHGASA